MSNEWSIRDEILKATQYWPWLVLFGVLGGLLGWGVSLVWPTPYRATRELFVGLNVYNAIEGRNLSEYSGIEVVNANDYKNWQMASLNSLIYMDSVLDETLHRLRDLNPYWNSVTQSDLSDSLHVYWRNAGKWRMVSENTNYELATQAVTAWQEVVLETVHHAVLQSQQAMTLEYQLEAIVNNQAFFSYKSQNLQRSTEELGRWKTELALRPPESALDSEDHWRLWQAAISSEMIDQWEALFDAFPSIGSLPKGYIDWIETAIPIFEQEHAAIETKVQDLISQKGEVSSQFSQAFGQSQGLSANLDVDAISTARTIQSITRPTGELMLIGSLLGLILGLVLWFSKISLRGEA